VAEVGQNLNACSKYTFAWSGLWLLSLVKTHLPLSPKPAGSYRSATPGTENRNTEEMACLAIVEPNATAIRDLNDC
jgi:hypothetical protein